ncbi:MAG: aspartate--tRNA ligase [Treponema sp.]|jgi:aspartyl-tRNA synthetase|nr:aspartate--tRNA ligase [Treponema sp.]
MENYKRTVTCGTLRKADAGRFVTLNGWVHRKRDHGGVSFINLRDRDGVTQIVADAELSAITTELRNEYCIAVEGTVHARPENMVNPEMCTGEIEVYASKIVILNKSEVPPFQIDEETNANEDLRLKYRYLDLRSGGMARRIRLRSEVAFAVREWLIKRGFLEIETPTFIKSTPEGARDYLVPSRLYAGKFYALPQSPQLYKQLLMVSGFDKYFQIARCYRDEDARGDRQPEFTQIDIEMSFVGREDVLTLTQGLMGHIFSKTLHIQLPDEFTRLTWEEARERFGTDKPDLRFGMELQDFAPFVEKGDFAAFKTALAEGRSAQAASKGMREAGGGVKALVVPGGAVFSRKRIEELEAHAKIYKAKGIAWFKIGADGSLEGGVAKFFAPQTGEIVSALGVQAGDLVLIVADAKRAIANTALGAVRSRLGKDLGLCDKGKFAFVWIIDFPLFEFNEEENRWEAAHHLFSSPKEEFLDVMEDDPGAVLGDLYDLVLNGYELASGSIRIHDPTLQKRVFAITGIGAEAAEQKFGFLTNAFKYGAPPHGGIAPGLDRLVMLMAGESSIKEVVAFPKNTFAVSPMDDCPSEVDQKQLDELHLNIK